MGTFELLQRYQARRYLPPEKLPAPVALLDRIYFEPHEITPSCQPVYGIVIAILDCARGYRVHLAVENEETFGSTQSLIHRPETRVYTHEGTITPAPIHGVAPRQALFNVLAPFFLTNALKDESGKADPDWKAAAARRHDVKHCYPTLALCRRLDEAANTGCSDVLCAEWVRAKSSGCSATLAAATAYLHCLTGVQLLGIEASEARQALSGWGIVTAADRARLTPWVDAFLHHPKVLEHQSAQTVAMAWKLARAIDQQDLPWLREALHTGNAASRHVFKVATGLTLPRTETGTLQALDAWAGVSVETRNALDAQTEQQQQTARQAENRLKAQAAEQQLERMARELPIHFAPDWEGDPQGKTLKLNALVTEGQALGWRLQHQVNGRTSQVILVSPDQNRHITPGRTSQGDRLMQEYFRLRATYQEPVPAGPHGLWFDRPQLKKGDHAGWLLSRVDRPIHDGRYRVIVDPRARWLEPTPGWAETIEHRLKLALPDRTDRTLLLNLLQSSHSPRMFYDEVAGRHPPKDTLTIFQGLHIDGVSDASGLVLLNESQARFEYEPPRTAPVTTVTPTSHDEETHTLAMA